MIARLPRLPRLRLRLMTQGPLPTDALSYSADAVTRAKAIDDEIRMFLPPFDALASGAGRRPPPEPEANAHRPAQETQRGRDDDVIDNRVGWGATTGRGGRRTLRGARFPPYVWEFPRQPAVVPALCSMVGAEWSRASRVRPSRLELSRDVRRSSSLAPDRAAAERVAVSLRGANTLAAAVPAW